LTFAAIGHARESGRAVFLAESQRIEELPGLISLPCARFVLLLAYDHGGPPARLTTALGELLDRGCVYLCAWGPGCSHVEDTMDDVALERDLEAGTARSMPMRALNRCSSRQHREYLRAWKRSHAWLTLAASFSICTRR
jgi:hypothetical protein